MSWVLLRIQKGLPYKCHIALAGGQPVYTLVFFFPATLRHSTNVVQAFYSKPQVAAVQSLAVHCQVQGTGLFYQNRANLG